MLTLDELLEQLRNRGLDPDILALVAAKLRKSAPAPTGQPYPPLTRALVERREAPDFPGNRTDQKVKIQQAITARWPHGIPDTLGRTERVSLIREWLSDNGHAGTRLPSIATVERELGYRPRS